MNLSVGGSREQRCGTSAEPGRGPGTPQGSGKIAVPRQLARHDVSLSVSQHFILGSLRPACCGSAHRLSGKKTSTGVVLLDTSSRGVMSYLTLQRVAAWACTGGCPAVTGARWQARLSVPCVRRIWSACPPRRRAPARTRVAFEASADPWGLPILFATFIGCRQTDEIRR